MNDVPKTIFSKWIVYQMELLADSEADNALECPDEIVEVMHHILCNLLTPVHNNSTISLQDIQENIDQPIKFIGLIGSVSTAKEIYGNQLPQMLSMIQLCLSLLLQSKKIETFLNISHQHTAPKSSLEELSETIPLTAKEKWVTLLYELFSSCNREEIFLQTLDILDDIKLKSKRVLKLTQKDNTIISWVKLSLISIGEFRNTETQTEIMEILQFWIEDLKNE